jgi:hypothetical protein
MRRVEIPIALVGLALMVWTGLALAGGGIAPPPPGTVGSKPTFRALVTLDPHNVEGDVFGTAGPTPTSTAKQASIQLLDPKKGTLLAEVAFTALPSFPLFLGCDTSMTQARFLFRLGENGNGAFLNQWVPPAALRALFASQGIATGPTNEPVFTSIANGAVVNGAGVGECIADPRNQGPLSDGSAPGSLFLDAGIQFFKPAAP